MPLTDPNKVLEFVQLSSVFTKRAMDAHKASDTLRKQAEAQIPELLTSMLKAGSITDEQTKIAETALKDHGQTLVILKRAVDYIATLRVTKTEEDRRGQ